MGDQILITSPSLDERENVSGVSAVIKQIIANGGLHKYLHFAVGSTDKQQKNLKWLFLQVFIFARFIPKLFTSSIKIIHLNTALEKFSIIRDFLLMIEAKVLSKKKIVLHIHGGFYLMNAPKEYWLKSIIKKFIRLADGVIVLSEGEKQRLAEEYNFHTAEVLPNVVDVENTTNKCNFETNKITLCFLGRVVTTKGIFDISDALKLLHPYYHLFDFKIYGAGPDLNKFLVELNKCQGLNFSYQGVVAGEEKWNALLSSQVFLLPSHFEGMPMSLLEAMACRCLVIVSNIPTLKTIIKDKENGLILERPSMLSPVLEKVLTNIHLYDEVRQNAYKTIKEGYNIPRYMKKLNAIYLNVCK